MELGPELIVSRTHARSLDVSDHGPCAARVLTSLRNSASIARQLSVGFSTTRKAQSGNYMELAPSGIRVDVVTRGVIMMRMGSE